MVVVLVLVFTASHREHLLLGRFPWQRSSTTTTVPSPTCTPLQLPSYVWRARRWGGKGGRRRKFLLSLLRGREGRVSVCEYCIFFFLPLLLSVRSNLVICPHRWISVRFLGFSIHPGSVPERCYIKGKEICVNSNCMRINYQLLLFMSQLPKGKVNCVCSECFSPVYDVTVM